MPFLEGVVPKLRNKRHVMDKILELNLIVDSILFHFIGRNLENITLVCPTEIEITENVFGFHPVDYSCKYYKHQQFKKKTGISTGG